MFSKSILVKFAHMVLEFGEAIRNSDPNGGNLKRIYDATRSCCC